MVALVALGCGPPARAQRADHHGLPPTLEHASHATRGPVEAEMKHVLYHVDDQVVLQIGHLRGALLPTHDAPPWFDDPESFTLAIDTGTVTISPASLSALLNRYVFNYKGTPLKDLSVTIEGDQLKQKGTLHKGIDLPFTIRARLSATPDGRLRLHPTSVKVAGIGVTGLMRTFGIELEKLVHVQQGRWRGDRRQRLPALSGRAAAAAAHQRPGDGRPARSGWDRADLRQLPSPRPV